MEGEIILYDQEGVELDRKHYSKSRSWKGIIDSWIGMVGGKWYVHVVPEVYGEVFKPEVVPTKLKLKKRDKDIEAKYVQKIYRVTPTRFTGYK